MAERYENEHPLARAELLASDARLTKVWLYSETRQVYGWVRLNKAQLGRFDTGAIFSIGISLDDLTESERMALRRLEPHYTTREVWAAS